ncbi:hypothetical protein [Candidatus Albibeggiatoa sp. nov. BB20]|uniref:hypothetical protein n=1 Tax=Candidatus Albibeggiatoa sp. nov. BB20 TaxID=3162723 RepID=UPI0033657836
MRLILRIISLLGVIVFSLLLGFSYSEQDNIEISAQHFVKQQIELKIREKYQHSKVFTFKEKAQFITNKFRDEEQKIKMLLENGLPEKIATVIAAMCGYDCEKKKQLTETITQSYTKRIHRIQKAQYNLQNMIKDQYVKVIGKLLTDIRIFCASNASLFLFILFISIVSTKAEKSLLLPTILLLISIIAASSMYLFGQDWFYTIIYNDYMGYSYLIYVGLIFLFLMDITFNKAMATSTIISMIINAIAVALNSSCG